MPQSSAAENRFVDSSIALRIVNDEPQEGKTSPNDKSRLADEILSTARKHRVQIRQDPVMVETLSQFNVTESIPPELYSAVAEILTFFQRLETGEK